MSISIMNPDGTVNKAEGKRLADEGAARRRANTERHRQAAQQRQSERAAAALVPADPSAIAESDRLLAENERLRSQVQQHFGDLEQPSDAQTYSPTGAAEHTRAFVRPLTPGENAAAASGEAAANQFAEQRRRQLAAAGKL